MADSNNDDNRQDRPPREGERRSGKRDPNNNNMASRGGMWWLLTAVLLIIFLILLKNSGQATEVAPAEFVQRARDNMFKPDSVFIEDDRMIGELKPEAPGQAARPGASRRISAQISRETKADYVLELQKIGQVYRESTGGANTLQIITYLLPVLLICFLIYFLLFRVRNAGGGAGMLGNFGRSRHKVTSKETSTITLADVAGIDEAKDEVFEIVEFLKNPKKFQRLGGRVPRGVLLIGSPGCGKTLLAKAVAGEADVPFFSISGSDFVEMFVGVGASRVRDLFKQAKESSPCIIFLDEIDAVGRRRGNGNFSGGHDEREQTLNAILVEMDGFETNDQVIVMAATNRSDVLDPALTRPGRFDRQIHVPLPDLRGRIEILKVHSKKIKMSPEVDIEKLARGTPMFSGADLAALINEAAIAATLANKDFVDQTDLEEARDKVRFGRANKSRKIEEKERIATAYHEAGHAVVQWLLKDADPVHKVTIIPRGRAMGATFSLPENDRYGYGKRYMLATMRVLCGGRIAEEKKTGDVTSGASMDIRMGTSYARAMLLQWGMSDKLGFVDYTPDESIETMMPEKSYSESTAKIVDDEIKRLTDEAYASCKQIIEENWDKVVAIAEALLQYETLNRDEIDRLMNGQTLAKPSVSEMLKSDNKGKPAPAKPAPSEPDAAPGAGPLPSPA